MTKHFSLMLLMLGLVSGVYAQGQDGNYFLQTCTAAIRSSDGEKLNVTDSMYAVYCPSYISGFMDGMSLQLTATKGRKVVCMPERGITNDQAARILVKYLRENPKVLYESGRMSFFVSLAQALPCGK